MYCTTLCLLVGALTGTYGTLWFSAARFLCSDTFYGNSTLFKYNFQMSVSQDMMVDEVNGGRESDTEDSEDDLPEIDLSSGNKDTSVLEVIRTCMQE